MKNVPCEQCPWRKANHGKKHVGGFYRKDNLRRLWNQVRGGGNQQSCHLTDPTHPDHIAAGAPVGATAKECPGSVIIVLREVRAMSKNNTIGDDEVHRYLKDRIGGLKKLGVLYWVMQRMMWAGKPLIGKEPLPEVDVSDEQIGLPEQLQPTWRDVV